MIDLLEMTILDSENNNQPRRAFVNANHIISIIPGESGKPTQVYMSTGLIYYTNDDPLAPR